MPRFPTYTTFHDYLVEHRESLVTFFNTRKGNHSLYTEMEYYVDVIAEMITWMYRAIQFAENTEDWRRLVAYQLLLSR